MECSEGLGICVRRQVVAFVEHQVLQSETVVTEQEIALVQAVLSNRKRGRVILERSSCNGAEGAVVDASQPEFPVEIADGRHYLSIALAAGSDDQLGGMARGQNVPAFALPDLGHPTERGEQLLIVIFLAEDYIDFCKVVPFSV